MFFSNKTEIVLTNGLIKKTRKIPAAVIEKAEAYRKEFISRYKNE
jgi:hypothetical protein